MNMTIKICLRPSSHSEDYTLVAEYASEEAAAKTVKALKRVRNMATKDEIDVDWNGEDAQITRKGKTVKFIVNTGGSINEAKAAMHIQTPKGFGAYTNYQELTITVKVPKGIARNVGIVPLVMNPEEANAILCLISSCGEPEVTRCGKKHEILTWNYRGERIYNVDEDVLHVADGIDLFERKNWTVVE